VIAVIAVRSKQHAAEIAGGHMWTIPLGGAVATKLTCLAVLMAMKLLT
jgi:hypothetical protein